MKHSIIFALIACSLCLGGCAPRGQVAGATSHASQAVNDRIGIAAEAEAKADVEKTPEAKAAAKAADKAIDRQAAADERAMLFRDGLGALLVVCLALAIRMKFPLLALPMDILATGAGGFTALAFALRVLMPAVPYVVVIGGIIAIVYHWRHSTGLQTVADDVARDARSSFVNLRGKSQDIIDRLRNHIDHHHAPPQRPLAPVSVTTLGPDAGKG